MQGLMLVWALSGSLGLPQAVPVPSAQSIATSPDAIPQDTRPRDATGPTATALEDVVVTGRRGAAEVAPELELDAEQIDNLGAYDIREVLARLSERLGLRQPPVVIVNGRRVVDARNFLGFPPDALVRVEALPPQAGALYGGDPSRRVFNIVLQPAFSSRDAQARASRPTAGGTTSLSLDARQSTIDETDTRQFGVQASRTTALHADERPDYLRNNPGREGITLRPATDSVSANAALTGTLGNWSTSLSANAQTQDTRFASTVGDQPLETQQSNDSLGINGGVSGQALGWSVRLGVDGLIAQGKQTGLTDVRSRNLSMIANLSADRTLIELPAGPVSATIDSQYARSRSEYDTDSLSLRQTSQSLDMRGNLTVPLLRAEPDAPGFRGGDLSVNLGGRLRALDDADAQGSGLNAGLAWSPFRKWQLSGQWARAVDGPTRQQRFDPVLFGPPRIVYDFRTGEAVEILPVLGGNADLRAQDTQSVNLSTSVGPFGPWGLQGNVSYQTTRSTDAIGSLPGFSPAVEAAFPDRFVRDTDGRLISIDQRAINLDSIAAQSLSSGITVNIPVGDAAPGSRRVGSLQIALNHSWQIENRITIRDGLAALDQLAGDGGGIPRHQVNLRLDGRYGKWGLNAAASWRGPSRIRRDFGVDGPDDVRLDALATVGLKLSYVFDAPVTTDPNATASRRNDGVRLELEVENLFDARPDAALGDGRAAPGYGRDDQDPLGRVFRVTASRRF